MLSASLLKIPDWLISKLRQHNKGSSQTKEILEQELNICHNRLKSIPKERKRLAECYRKGLYSDAMMREEIGIIDKEHGELETRIKELEKQLFRRILTGKQEINIRKTIEKVNTSLDNLDFKGRQRLVRLLPPTALWEGDKGDRVVMIINTQYGSHPTPPLLKRTLISHPAHPRQVDLINI